MSQSHLTSDWSQIFNSRTSNFHFTLHRKATQLLPWIPCQISATPQSGTFAELRELVEERGNKGWWKCKNLKKTHCMLSKTHTGNATRHNWIVCPPVYVSKFKDLFPVFSWYQFEVLHTYLYYSCFPLCCWGSQLSVLWQQRQGSHSLLRRGKWKTT